MCSAVSGVDVTGLCPRSLQMLDHFAECVKQAKGVRQQAVQLNIFTAVLSALKVPLLPGGPVSASGFTVVSAFRFHPRDW